MHPVWGGAGGNWPIIEEIFDPAIAKQENLFSCGAACGVMLLSSDGIYVSQSEITAIAGVPMTAPDLA
jgi:hypothetical protein